MLLHGVLMLGAFWVSGETATVPPSGAPVEITRSYAVQYVTLAPPPPPTPSPPPKPERPNSSAGPRSAARPDAREPAAHLLAQVLALAPEAPRAARPTAPVVRSDLDPALLRAGGETPPAPHPASRAVEQLDPGGVISVAGAAIDSTDLERAARAGVARAGGVETGSSRGDADAGHDSTDPRAVTRVAELIGAAGTACPALRRPPSRRDGVVAVIVEFVVDKTGAVDPATVRVVQSPDRPRADYQFYTHLYAIAAGAEVDEDLARAGADYDAVVTGDVLRHVKSLRFRPALRDGHPVRSTVLVSCQSS